MITYAGIGSRQISQTEKATILEIAGRLAKLEYVVYSGNADGSDMTFQTGSGGKTVLMLPWKGFNNKVYNVENSLAWFDLGNGHDGQSSVKEFHPAPDNLSSGANKMMARNYYQIHGVPYKGFPQVSFVICCADQDKNGIKGGTGQAVRIATSMWIPVVNIRAEGWEDRLEGVLESINNKCYECAYQIEWQDTGGQMLVCQECGHENYKAYAGED